MYLCATLVGVARVGPHTEELLVHIKEVDLLTYVHNTISAPLHFLKSGCVQITRDNQVGLGKHVKTQAYTEQWRHILCRSVLRSCSKYVYQCPKHKMSICRR